MAANDYIGLVTRRTDESDAKWESRLLEGLDNSEDALQAIFDELDRQGLGSGGGLNGALAAWGTLCRWTEQTYRTNARVPAHARPRCFAVTRMLPGRGGSDGTPCGILAHPIRVDDQSFELKLLSEPDQQTRDFGAFDVCNGYAVIVAGQRARVGTESLELAGNTEVLTRPIFGPTGEGGGRDVVLRIYLQQPATMPHTVSTRVCEEIPMMGTKVTVDIVAAWARPPSPPLQPVENDGYDCWSACDEASGACTWCGLRGVCCRSDWAEDGCGNDLGCDGFHCCVDPTPTAPPLPSPAPPTPTPQAFIIDQADVGKLSAGSGSFPGRLVVYDDADSIIMTFDGLRVSETSLLDVRPVVGAIVLQQAPGMSGTTRCRVRSRLGGGSTKYIVEPLVSVEVTEIVERPVERLASVFSGLERTRPRRHPRFPFFNSYDSGRYDSDEEGASDGYSIETNPRVILLRSVEGIPAQVELCAASGTCWSIDVDKTTAHDVPSSLHARECWQRFEDEQSPLHRAFACAAAMERYVTPGEKFQSQERVCAGQVCQYTQTMGTVFYDGFETTFSYSLAHGEPPERATISFIHFQFGHYATEEGTCMEGDTLPGDGSDQFVWVPDATGTTILASITLVTDLSTEQQAAVAAGGAFLRYSTRVSPRELFADLRYDRLVPDGVTADPAVHLIFEDPVLQQSRGAQPTFTLSKPLISALPHGRYVFEQRQPAVATASIGPQHQLTTKAAMPYLKEVCRDPLVSEADLLDRLAFFSHDGRQNPVYLSESSEDYKLAFASDVNLFRFIPLRQGKPRIPILHTGLNSMIFVYKLPPRYAWARGEDDDQDPAEMGKCAALYENCDVPCSPKADAEKYKGCLPNFAVPKQVRGCEVEILEHKIRTKLERHCFTRPQDARVFHISARSTYIFQKLMRKGPYESSLYLFGEATPRPLSGLPAKPKAGQVGFLEGDHSAALKRLVDRAHLASNRFTWLLMHKGQAFSPSFHNGKHAKEQFLENRGSRPWWQGNIAHEEVDENTFRWSRIMARR